MRHIPGMQDYINGRVSIRKEIPKININTHEYAGDDGEYEGDAGEYCGDVGLYWGDVGEYWGDVGE